MTSLVAAAEGCYRCVFKPGFFVIYSQNFDSRPADRAISGRQVVMAIWLRPDRLPDIPVRVTRSFRSV